VAYVIAVIHFLGGPAPVTIFSGPDNLADKSPDKIFQDRVPGTGNCFLVMANKKPHPLFKSAPQAVQDLSAQAQSEQRAKARQIWWQQNNGDPKKLAEPTKPS
jgi:hypothetical protein